MSSPDQRVKEELQNVTVAPVSSPCLCCLLPSNTLTSLVCLFLPDMFRGIANACHHMLTALGQSGSLQRKRS